MKDDTISRKAAIDAIDKLMVSIPTVGGKDLMDDVNRIRAEDISVIKRLPSAQPESHWTPCSERLPEDDVEVFVYLFERQTPYIAWVEDCRWYTEDFEVEKENYPTAWMPLPEPYAERRQND